MSKETAQVRDQLGLDPAIYPFVIPDFDENIKIYELPLTIKKDAIGNSWIVGSYTNGKVGTNTSTQGGGQQVVGGSGRVITLQHVLNTNNTYNEFFTTTLFKDATTSTGGWTTVGTATVTGGQILRSGTIYKDTGSALTAIMSVNFTTGNAGSVTCLLSATGTAVNQFGTATLDSSYTFPTSGRNLCWQIRGGTATITNVKITYTTN